MSISSHAVSRMFTLSLIVVILVCVFYVMQSAASWSLEGLPHIPHSSTPRQTRYTEGWTCAEHELIHRRSTDHVDPQKDTSPPIGVGPNKQTGADSNHSGSHYVVHTSSV